MSAEYPDAGTTPRVVRNGPPGRECPGAPAKSGASGRSQAAIQSSSDAGLDTVEKRANGGRVPIFRCPRREHGIGAAEWAARRLVEYEDARTDQERVKNRARNPIKKGPPGGDISHRNRIRHGAVFVEEYHVDLAFNHVERFAFSEVFVRPHIGVVRVDDQHLVEGIGDTRVGAQPNPLAWVSRRVGFEPGNVLRSYDHDRIRSVQHLGALNPRGRHRARSSLHTSETAGSGRMNRPPLARYALCRSKIGSA